MLTLLIVFGALATAVVVFAALIRPGQKASRGPGVVDVENLRFTTARELLQYMKEQRIGYIAVRGGGHWEAKDPAQQGIVNLLREKYFELHEQEQRRYFSELSSDYVSQARELMSRRPAGKLAGYRQQLLKLMIYVKDADCRNEIQAELAAIMPALLEEQVRAAIDNPPARPDAEHLALLENFLEEHPRWTLARELEAEIARVKGVIGGQP